MMLLKIAIDTVSSVNFDSKLMTARCIATVLYQLQNYLATFLDQIWNSQERERGLRPFRSSKVINNPDKVSRRSLRANLNENLIPAAFALVILI